MHVETQTISSPTTDAEERLKGQIAASECDLQRLNGGIMSLLPSAKKRRRATEHRKKVLQLMLQSLNNPNKLTELHSLLVEGQEKSPWEIIVAEQREIMIGLFAMMMVFGLPALSNWKDRLDEQLRQEGARTTLRNLKVLSKDKTPEAEEAIQKIEDQRDRELSLLLEEAATQGDTSELPPQIKDSTNRLIAKTQTRHEDTIANQIRERPLGIPYRKTEMDTVAMAVSYREEMLGLKFAQGDISSLPASLQESLLEILEDIAKGSNSYDTGLFEQLRTAVQERDAKKAKDLVTAIENETFWSFSESPVLEAHQTKVEKLKDRIIELRAALAKAGLGE
jgi:hypothetical protein